MKRLALIILLATGAFASGATDAAGDLLKQAQAASAARDFEGALGLYEQVITRHPEALDRWFGAQEAIANTLAAKGDLPEAAKAAHIAMDGAPNGQAYDIAVMLAANILSAMDKSVDRANQFLTYQLTGSSGAASNPMDAIGYPSSPGREQSLAAMRQQAGDNVAASILRAYTYLYSGDPHDALAQFADAFRRSSGSDDLSRSASELVSVGLRDVHGTRAGLDKAVRFVVLGPNGPDGTPNSADDIADPFAGLLPNPPAPGGGGLTGPDPAALAALSQVREAARLYAGDPRLRQDLRHAALLALAKANDALDAWGAPGEEEWYLAHALDADQPSPDGLFFTGAQAAARGGALNLGGVYAMWRQVDTFYAAHQLKPTRGPETARREFAFVIAMLNRIQFAGPGIKLLRAPATFGAK